MSLPFFCAPLLSALAFLIFSRWVGVKSHSDNLPGNTLPRGPPARSRATYSFTATSVTGVFMLLAHFHSNPPYLESSNQITSECAETRFSVLSLWCSPVNMPASHAGDHRSEAGQGRQFHRRVVHGEQQTHLTQNQAALDVQVVSRRPFRPQSIVSDAFAR